MDYSSPESLRFEIGNILEDRFFGEVASSADAALRASEIMSDGADRHSEFNASLFPNHFERERVAELARTTNYLDDLNLVSATHTPEAGHQAAENVYSSYQDRTDEIEALRLQVEDLRNQMARPTPQEEMLSESRIRAIKAHEQGIDIPAEFRADEGQFTLAA